MNGRLPLLTGLLIAQLLLIGGASLLGGGGEQARDLLDADATLVTGLTVTDSEANTRTLTRGAAGWQLEGGIPADDVKITTVIERLGNCAWGR